MVKDLFQNMIFHYDMMTIEYVTKKTTKGSERQQTQNDKTPVSILFEIQPNQTFPMKFVIKRSLPWKLVPYRIVPANVCTGV